MRRALVIGSKGTIGAAIVKQLCGDYRVDEISRQNCDYTDVGLADHAKRLAQHTPYDLIICCIGVLHNDRLSPEKRLSQLDAGKLTEYFQVNTILPALCIRQFTQLLKRPAGDQGVGRFVVLSAMVGSIEDNQLGGWYGYRSSKAALNMLIKSAAIEIARTNKQFVLVAMHPGTTIGRLSKPFAGNVSEDKYYTPEQSAKRIIGVAESLQVTDNACFFNWDGNVLPW